MQQQARDRFVVWMLRHQPRLYMCLWMTGVIDGGVVAPGHEADIDALMQAACDALQGGN